MSKLPFFRFAAPSTVSWTVNSWPSASCAGACSATLRGSRLARADLIDEVAGSASNLLHDAAHFQPDLDADVVLQEHVRLDVQLQADFEIVHGLRNDSGRGRGGRDDRNLVADMDLGFFTVLHADARIREKIGLALLLLEIGDHERIGDRETHQARVAAAQLGKGEGAASARAGDARACLGGAADAQWRQ